jgi:hypothetical protein
MLNLTLEILQKICGESYPLRISFEFVALYPMQQRAPYGLFLYIIYRAQI